MDQVTLPGVAGTEDVTVGGCASLVEAAAQLSSSVRIAEALRASGKPDEEALDNAYLQSAALYLKARRMLRLVGSGPVSFDLVPPTGFTREVSLDVVLRASDAYREAKRGRDVKAQRDLYRVCCALARLVAGNEETFEGVVEMVGESCPPNGS